MSTEKELPKYKCYKEVWALKIVGVEYLGPGRGGILRPEESEYGAIEVSEDYIEKHDPYPGGYYVVYKDGYKSFSPAKAFEDGYTKI